MSDARIVLVKPGDVLMLGNVTIPDDEAAREAIHEALRTLKETLGLAGDILVFEDDIDLAVKPGGWYDRGGHLPSALKTVHNSGDTAEQVRYGLGYIRDRYGKDG